MGRRAIQHAAGHDDQAPPTSTCLTQAPVCTCQSHTRPAAQRSSHGAGQESDIQAYNYLYVNSNLQSTTSVPAANNSWWFYAGGLWTRPCRRLSAVPFNGAANVGVNVTPGVVFSKAIDPLSVNSNTFTVSNGGAPLAGSYWFSANDTRIEFVPNAPLPTGTALTMTLNGVLDSVGHAVNFSRPSPPAGPDVTSPSVVWASVANGGSMPINSSISVQFSESMDVTTFNTCAATSCSADFYLYDTLLSQYVPATLSWNSRSDHRLSSAQLAAGRGPDLQLLRQHRHGSCGQPGAIL